jgi:hypothetical protein
LSIHVFQPSSEGPLDAEAEGDEASSSYCEWELPAAAFCGLWESLIYGQVSLLFSPSGTAGSPSRLMGKPKMATKSLPFQPRMGAYIFSMLRNA